MPRYEVRTVVRVFVEAVSPVDAADKLCVRLLNGADLSIDSLESTVVEDKDGIKYVL